ncbi:hypothetical protein C8R43DRAFT_965804 [Mycena crocata]|nr:hypothetical protein C8R43DRAFT_965804 [Mycena crocata]
MAVRIMSRTNIYIQRNHDGFPPKKQVNNGKGTTDPFSKKDTRSRIQPAPKGFTIRIPTRADLTRRQSAHGPGGICEPPPESLPGLKSILDKALTSTEGTGKPAGASTSESPTGTGMATPLESGDGDIHALRPLALPAPFPSFPSQLPRVSHSVGLSHSESRGIKIYDPPTIVSGSWLSTKKRLSIAPIADHICRSPHLLKLTQNPSDSNFQPIDNMDETGMLNPSISAALPVDEYLMSSVDDFEGETADIGLYDANEDPYSAYGAAPLCQMMHVDFDSA